MKKKIVSFLLITTLAVPIGVNILPQGLYQEITGKNSTGISYAGDDEYTSSYNPIPPSEAPDSLVVNIPDPVLNKEIKMRLSLGEHDDITTGKMKTLTTVSPDFQNHIKSLEGLQYAENLELIFIHRNTRVSIYYKEDYISDPNNSHIYEKNGFLQPLKNSKKLKSVFLMGSNVTSADMEDLKNNDLETLDVDYSYIRDLSFLKFFNNLESLFLNDAFIIDINEVQNLKKLKELNISYNMIEDFSILSENKALEKLDMMNNLTRRDSYVKSIDISFITELPNLMELKSVQNGHTDITPVIEHPSLNSILLNGNRITNIQNLEVEMYDEESLADQVNTAVLEKGRYVFSFPVFGSKGTVAYLEDIDDGKIEKTRDTDYRLKNTKEVVFQKEWSVKDGAMKGPLQGVLNVVNKNRVDELLLIAKMEPTDENISQIKHSLNKISNHLLAEPETIFDWEQTVLNEANSISIDPFDISSVFNDVNEHWGKPYISKTYRGELFKGTNATTFSPDVNMTRGMFVTVLGRLAGTDYIAMDTFSDVDKDAYYAGYVEWAQSEGIVKGYGDDTFRPDNNITREEMATLIKRYMDYRNIKLKDNDLPEFSDFDKTSEWAKDNVRAIQKSGIIEGKGEGIFDPQSNSTRAEVATILVRMIEEYIK